MTALKSGRVPPKDLGAERACIGCALLDRSCCDELMQMLTPQDFYSESHAKIWEALQQLASQYITAVDTVGLRAQLGSKLEAVGGDDYLMELTDTIPTLSLAEKHATRVRELSAVREMITRCHEVAASGYGDITNLSEWLDWAEQTMGQETKRPGTVRSVPFRDVIMSTFDAIKEQSERKVEMLGPATGFAKLDKYTKGLAPGQLWIAAGRPGMGKTALADGIVTRAGPSLVFSLEMLREEWGRRRLSSAARIDGLVLRGAVDITDNEWMALTRSAGEESELPIDFWDGSGTTITEIVRESRRVARVLRRNGEDLNLIVIDYLQLIRPAKRGRSREEEVAEFSRDLKNLAKELGCAVLALAQLNRAVEQRPNKRPLMSDLRESGAVEQDADVILFIYRDEVYNEDPPGKSNKGIAEIIIAKNRPGRTGICTVAWLKEFTTFEPLAYEWQD